MLLFSEIIFPLRYVLLAGLELGVILLSLLPKHWGYRWESSCLVYITIHQVPSAQVNTWVNSLAKSALNNRQTVTMFLYIINTKLPKGGEKAA